MGCLVSKDDRDLMAKMYRDGKSIPQISDAIGVNRSRVRLELLKCGVALRSRTEGIKNREDLGFHMRGKTRAFSQEWRSNIAESRRRWAEKNAAGASIKATGYVVTTRGENKDRAEHVLVMEERLGRKLLPDEVVHHIDRDKSNNSIDNLALVTRSGHSRLHRFEDKLQGLERKRQNGRFC